MQESFDKRADDTMKGYLKKLFGAGNEKELERLPDSTYKKIHDEITTLSNLGYKKKSELLKIIKQYVPNGDERKNFYKMLDYLETEAKKGLEIAYGRKNVVIGLLDLAEKYDVANKDSINRHLGNTKVIHDLTQERDDKMMKLAEYENKMKSIMEKLNETSQSVAKKLLQYEKGNTEGKESKIGGVVVLAIAVLFSGVVLWALSQISPENVTLGAFFVESGSPMLLAMLTSVVIFLIFFLTHHRLK